MAAYAALLSLSHTTDLTRLEYESIFASNAVKNVRSIHDYVNFLLSFFENFPEKVNRWECRIRDLAYDAEDIIEVFVWQRIHSRHGSTIYHSRVLEVQLQDVTTKIGSIAGEVMEERPPYRPPSSSSSSSSRLAAAGNDAVVGLEEDVRKMMDQLCGESSNLQVIPIVGMGGIGKSTLARTMYDDRYMLRRFDIRAWVVVSQDYNPHRFRKVLLDSMRLLDKEQTSGDEMNDSEIALRVSKILKWRRYLIVIDDIWSTEVWDDVRNIFPDDNNGSRIMLTTRQSEVATYPVSNSPVHEMQVMNEAQCWDLLKQKVFGNSNCQHELEDVGKEIARRCAGLPLAVVLVAGVLSQEDKTQASWEEIAKNVNLVVGREIDEILSLSYTYLPHHLRSCFLFIGYFVEDVNISSSRLIRLWVAEGFVKHKDGCSKSLEEDAEEYMEDLVKRNLMIVTSRKSDGKIKSCSLHDMVRGLCMSKAHEEKFLHLRDGRCLPLMNKRRIIFSHSDKTTIWGAAFLTILGFQNIPSLLTSYKLLRVLDALAVDLNELPSEAFELYHLRYLAVMGSFSIPSLVYNLVNLQTIIVHLASGKPQERSDDDVPRSLPLEIWRMPQLRHIFFHAPYMLPYPLEGINYLPLENLQTLLLIKDFVWDEKIIRMIPNVKKLGLHYSKSQEYHLYHLKDMHHLVKLEVTGYLEFSWSIQIPRSFPCTLKKLTLVGGGFPWKDMVVVGSLPCLQVLKLLGNVCDGDSWETTDEEFPLLKVLVIDGSYLRQWITDGSPFPTLKHLVLRSCRYLREIPKDLGEIPTLELIELDDCRKSVFESAKKIKEDQENYGNDALQVRFGHEFQTYVTRSLKEIKEAQGTAVPVLQSSVRSALKPENLLAIVSGPSGVRRKDLLTITETEEGNQLEELEFLNISGRLELCHLERVRDHLDAKKANLAEKKNLRELKLSWGRNRSSKLREDFDNDERVLEALEPHPNLEQLTISGFGGRCFPGWMTNSTLEKIVRIDLQDCWNCSRLPKLGTLPHLKRLSLLNVGVEYIIEDEDEVGSENLAKVQFLALESLRLVNLPNLRGLWKEEESKEAFPNLKILNVNGCSLLMLPPLPYLKKLKRLVCSSSTLALFSKLDFLTILHVIEETTPCFPMETLVRFSNLHLLTIDGAKEISVPVDGLQTLNALKALYIWNCKTMRCIPVGLLLDLTALRSLYIWRCPELVELPEEIKHLHNLELIHLHNLPLMAYLPEALQHLSSLSRLYIERLVELESLPDCLQHLTSLRLKECPKLVSLPPSILDCLKELRMKRCPELERRCTRGSGDYWQKIAHIPNLWIGE